MAITNRSPSALHCLHALIILTLDPLTGVSPSTTEAGEQDSLHVPKSDSVTSPQNYGVGTGTTAHDTPSMETCGVADAHEEDLGENSTAEDIQHLTRNFISYEQVKSTREVNEAIKEELLKSHPATEGCIYGFLHPRNTIIRIGSDSVYHTQIIKIGRSVNVKRRMKEWRKQCKYQPLIVLNIMMPHHQRIERVVHHQLHNSRLKEYPGCSGCGLQHNEWFRVSTIYAAFLVGMWRDFAYRQPYDEDGELLPDWLERLNQVDLEDPGCWMWFILETALTELIPPSSYAEGQGDGFQALSLTSKPQP